MAISFAYPTVAPELQDLLIGTEVAAQGGEDSPRTRTFTVGSIVNLIGTVSGVPNLQQVTTVGPTTTNTININKAYSLQALVITGDNAPNGLVQIDTNDGPGLKVNTSDGIGIHSSCTSSAAMYGITTDGTGVQALAISDEGTALLVSGPAKGIRVNNGGIRILGTVYGDTGYQLSLSANSAMKPGGGSWDGASDSRLKENIIPYTKGLTEILLIDPVTYEYNGLAGTTKGEKYTGVIAQEIKEIFPETVSIYKAKLNENDEEATDLYNFNASDLTFALINAVKQLSAEIELLKSI